MPAMLVLAKWFPVHSRCTQSPDMPRQEQGVRDTRRRSHSPTAGTGGPGWSQAAAERAEDDLCLRTVWQYGFSQPARGAHLRHGQD